MYHKEEIIGFVKALNLPLEKYWLCSGAGLVLHGVREFAGDIDIGCDTEVFETILNRGGALSHTADGNRAIRDLEPFEFFENWTVREVVNLEGIPVASLLSLKEQKQKLGREKDLLDIALIDAFLNGGKAN